MRLQQDDATVSLLELTGPRLRHELGRAAFWYVLSRDGRVPALPPQYVVDDMLAHPNPLLPHLERVTAVPVFGPTGSLVTAPGYHVEARIYYAPATSFIVPTVPSTPTPTDLRLARTLLVEDLLGDFPFTGDAELAHAVSAALLPFVRSLVEGPTPLHLIEKPSPGTGAGLLAQVLCYPALGRGPTVMTLGRSEDETRRTLTAKLGETRRIQVVVATRPHGCESSSSLKTSEGVLQLRVFRGRRLSVAATAAMSRALCLLVSPFGEVLAQQAVGVFVRSPLPRTTGVAEEYVQPAVDSQSGVLGHLGALVPGQ